MEFNEIVAIREEVESHFGTTIYNVFSPIICKYITKDIDFEVIKDEILNKYMIAAHDYVNRNRKWKSYDW